MTYRGNIYSGFTKMNTDNNMDTMNIKICFIFFLS